MLSGAQSATVKVPLSLHQPYGDITAALTIIVLLSTALICVNHNSEYFYMAITLSAFYLCQTSHAFHLLLWISCMWLRCIINLTSLLRHLCPALTADDIMKRTVNNISFISISKYQAGHYWKQSCLKWKYLRGSSEGIWLLEGQGYGLLLGHRLLKKAVLRKQECDKRSFVPCAVPFIVWYGILRLGQVSLVRFKVTENIKCFCDMKSFLYDCALEA